MFFTFAEVARETDSFGLGSAVFFVLAGLVLLGLEIFLPGLVCGIFGAIFVIGGVGLIFHLEGMMGGMIATGAVGVVLLLGFWFYVKILPETRFGKKLFLSGAVEGAGAEAPGDDSLIGLDGTAVTVLAPSGMVRVGDAQYEAVSRDGFLERGESVVILGRETLRLIVGKKGGTA